jgi:periplasmic divalent cation tolerance protein
MGEIPGRRDWMDGSYCVMLSTAGSEEEANRLAKILVTKQLAACVQISRITSWYSWKGKTSHEPEHLLLIKTKVDLYKKVEAEIVANHSYEVPEIVQLPIAQGLDRYLGWIGENTQS